MEIRPLHETDGDAYLHLREYCFSIPSAHGDAWLAHKFRPEQTLGAFVAGEMRAAATVLPFQLHVDGTVLPMGGVAGVVSDPTSRRSGAVGRLLVAALQKMHAAGQIISCLNPFDIGFYRRYGWELAGMAARRKLATTELRPFAKSRGELRRYGPAEARAFVQSAAPVYDAVAATRRGFMVRPDLAHWDLWQLRCWRGDANWHAATWHPEWAWAQGYVVYRIEQRGQPSTLRVAELVALTPEAYRGLLGYLANHDSQVDQVEWFGPVEEPIDLLLSQATRKGWQHEPTFLLRLVDAPKAVKARSVPTHLRGAFTLDLTDEQAPWNQGRWSLEFADGRVAMKPVPVSEQAADVVADIAVLSGLYAAAFAPEAALLSGRLVASELAASLMLEAWGGAKWFHYEYF